jgi:hypothetical protein
MKPSPNPPERVELNGRWYRLESTEDSGLTAKEILKAFEKIDNASTSAKAALLSLLKSKK